MSPQLHKSRLLPHLILTLSGCSIKAGGLSLVNNIGLGNSDELFHKKPGGFSSPKTISNFLLLSKQQ